MTKYLLTAAAVMTLAGCSTIMENSTQTIHFQAVGATEAVCDIEIGASKYKYKITMPQRAEIKKSKNDMVLVCRAAGNRYKSMRVPAELSGWTYANVTNGVLPGTAYDAETGAMFKYPDVIVVDFTDTVAIMDALPAYHAVDTLNPGASSSSVEDMGPSSNKLSGDDATALRHKMAQLQRDRDDALDAERTERRETVEGGWTGDKGGAGMSAGSASPSYVPPPYMPPVADDSLSSPPSGNPTPNRLPSPVFPSTTSF